MLSNRLLASNLICVLVVILLNIFLLYYWNPSPFTHDIYCIKNSANIFVGSVHGVYRRHPPPALALARVEFYDKKTQKWSTQASAYIYRPRDIYIQYWANRHEYRTHTLKNFLVVWGLSAGHPWGSVVLSIYTPPRGILARQYIYCILLCILNTEFGHAQNLWHADPS